MDCEICNTKDPHVIVSLPVKKTDGYLNTMACLACAEKSEHYCLKHTLPHLGFVDDDTTACIQCINETVRGNQDRAQRIYNQILDALPDGEDREGLIEAADLARTLDHVPIPMAVLKFVATKAHRLDTTIDEIVSWIVSQKQALTILSLRL